MNAHRGLGLLAAVLVTVGQALLLAVDTAAVAQVAENHASYGTTLSAGADAEKAVILA